MAWCQRKDMGFGMRQNWVTRIERESIWKSSDTEMLLSFTLISFITTLLQGLQAPFH